MLRDPQNTKLALKALVKEQLKNLERTRKTELANFLEKYWTRIEANRDAPAPSGVTQQRISQ